MVHFTVKVECPARACAGTGLGTRLKAVEHYPSNQPKAPWWFQGQARGYCKYAAVRPTHLAMSVPPAEGDEESYVITGGPREDYKVFGIEYHWEEPYVVGDVDTYNGGFLAAAEYAGGLAP